MKSFTEGTTDPKYALPTIGGIFGSADQERFLIAQDSHQFDEYFPDTVRGKVRAHYETGIDALAGILLAANDGRAQFRIWTTENFCRESLDRLNIKLRNRVEFVTYQNPDDCRNAAPGDFVLYLHFNCYDPASIKSIEMIKQQTGATVIEDFAHAPLDIARFSGDFAFNSLRKFSSLDLAVAYHNGPPRASTEETQYHKLRKVAEQVRTQFFDNPSEELERRFLRFTRESEAALAVSEVSTAHPNEIARSIAFDFHTVQSLRRRNYSHLVKEFTGRLPEIKILPGDYMYVMIESTHRDRLRADLFAQRVFPAIHWADSGSERAKLLLSFHIDQRYSLADMDRVAAIVATHASLVC